MISLASVKCPDKTSDVFQLYGKKAFEKSSVASNFNYFHLLWIILNIHFLTKIENIHKRTLCFLLSNYADKVAIKVNRLRTFKTTFKTID